MATECGLHVEAGTLKTTPALYVEEAAMKDVKSPKLHCFIGRIVAHKFSADFGFIGNEAGKPKS